MVRIDLKQKRARLRKNFFPTLVVIVILWISLAAIVFYIDPETFGIIPSFFFLVFLTFFFTTSMLFTNTKRGFLVAAGLTIFLILRFLGVGNILNLLLISGIIISLDIYLSKHKY